MWAWRGSRGADTGASHAPGARTGGGHLGGAHGRGRHAAHVEVIHNHFGIHSAPVPRPHGAAIIVAGLDDLLQLQRGRLLFLGRVAKIEHLAHEVPQGGRVVSRGLRGSPGHRHRPASLCRRRAARLTAKPRPRPRPVARSGSRPVARARRRPLSRRHLFHPRRRIAHVPGSRRERRGLGRRHSLRLRLRGSRRGLRSTGVRREAPRRCGHCRGLNRLLHPRRQITHLARSDDRGGTPRPLMRRTAVGGVAVGGVAVGRLPMRRMAMKGVAMRRVPPPRIAVGHSRVAVRPSRVAVRGLLCVRLRGVMRVRVRVRVRLLLHVGRVAWPLRPRPRLRLVRRRRVPAGIDLPRPHGGGRRGASSRP